MTGPLAHGRDERRRLHGLEEDSHAPQASSSTHVRQRDVHDALFGVLAAGSAYAANTVFSSDIVDGEVKSVDIGNNEIGSADVKDDSINTFDVHSFLGVDVVDGSLEDRTSAGLFGPGGACVDLIFTGVDAQGDHLLLTPSATNADNALQYTAMYRSLNGNCAALCNPTASPVDDGFTNFNLLVFDAKNMSRGPRRATRSAPARACARACRRTGRASPMR